MTEQEKSEIFDEWVCENQPRITAATIAALRKVDGVSEAMTDPDASGLEARKIKVEAVITASHAVLAEYIGEEFDREFSSVDNGFRIQLKQNSELAAREHLSNFIDLLLELA